MKKKYYLKWIKNPQVRQIYKKTAVADEVSNAISKLPSLLPKTAEESRRVAVYRKRFEKKNRARILRNKKLWHKRNREKDRESRRRSYKKMVAAGYRAKIVWVKLKTT